MQNMAREIIKLVAILETDGWLVSVDSPLKVQGQYWIDIEKETQKFIIAWKIGNGFGLSSQGSGLLGEGHDETYAIQEDLLKRLKSLYQITKKKDF
jgi:hypothetical protein